jgi:hypothetical protein
LQALRDLPNHITECLLWVIRDQVQPAVEVLPHAACLECGSIRGPASTHVSRPTGKPNQIFCIEASLRPLEIGCAEKRNSQAGSG